MGAFRVVYTSAVMRDDIPKLTRVHARRVRKAIEAKLKTDPLAYGLPLRRSLKGYWKLRVGDYRVVFRVVDDTVIVFAVLHRDVVYTLMLKRLERFL